MKQTQVSSATDSVAKDLSLHLAKVDFASLSLHEFVYIGSRQELRCLHQHFRQGNQNNCMSRLCRSNLFFEEFFLELHLSEMYDEKGCIICIISETSPHFTGHIKG